MEIPEGIECATEVKLCGLKVSPKCWNEKFTEVLKRFGLQPNSNEPCLFTWRDGNKFLILILYVDDILLACSDREKMNEVKQNLCRNFDMTDIGEPKSFLGLNITSDRKAKVLKINQEKYIMKMLTKFGFQDMYLQRTPMITSQVANKEQKGTEDSRTGKRTDKIVRYVPYNFEVKLSICKVFSALFYSSGFSFRSCFLLKSFL